ncbi:MAG: superinfection immunity protein [Betaproteobacteria bacterium]|nr:superinfection immunity protein [Betaproteobacteria bacterium]
METGTILLIILAIVYFIPSLIGNEKQHAAGIFVVNLFLGWTLLGWVVALAWALSSPKSEKANIASKQQQEKLLNRQNKIEKAMADKVSSMRGEKAVETTAPTQKLESKLTNCPACEHSVSRMAKSCPQCGHPF